MTAETSITIVRLRQELKADRDLWVGLVDRLPVDDPMHTTIILRLASIESVLERTK